MEIACRRFWQPAGEDSLLLDLLLSDFHSSINDVNSSNDDRKIGTQIAITPGLQRPEAMLRASTKLVCRSELLANLRQCRHMIKLSMIWTRNLII